jgi:nucleoside-diphosphate-sugar epimerase
VAFDHAEAALAAATHVLSCVPPDASGDPVLARYAEKIAAAPRLRWIGYLSSTVVYGDRGGGWVDEDSPPAPAQERGHRRLAAEQGWARFADRLPVDIFRLAGIYGPGRSAFDDLRAGRARRIAKPGHAFGRIHRDDIAAAVLAAMRQPRPPGPRILNLNDDAPAETADVIAEAARLLGIDPPPALPFDQVLPTMSPMARSFWAENRKVSGRKTQAALGIVWRYPTYREGLRAILAEERGQHPA